MLTLLTFILVIMIIYDITLTVDHLELLFFNTAFAYLTSQRVTSTLSGVGIKWVYLDIIHSVMD